MNKNILAGLSFIIILLMLSCSTGKTNTISGTIFVSGNEPFTYLALKGENDTYYKLECEETLEKELWSMQGQMVNLEYSEIKQMERESIATVIKLIIQDNQ